MKLIKVQKKKDVNEYKDFGHTDTTVRWGFSPLSGNDNKVEVTWYSAGNDKSIAKAKEHLKNLAAAIKYAEELEKK